MKQPERATPGHFVDRILNPNRGPDWWLMLTKFLQRGRVIASFAPSSRYMARAVLRGIDFTTNPTIVELGAGTGPITEVLLKLATKKSRVLIVELDSDLCARLRTRFPDAEIVEADASQLDKLLEERGITQVDHVVSGLPLPSIPEPIRTQILEQASKCLAPNGTFRQLTIMPWIYYRMYRRHFTDLQFRFVFRNLPPGGVYVCQGFTDRA